MAETMAAAELAAGDFIKLEGETLRLHRVSISRDPTVSVGYIKRDGGKGKNIGDVTFESDEQVEVIARWPSMAGGWRM